jgi:hypothetical protein
VTRRSFTGPRVWGLLLLAAGIAVLAATTAVRSQEGYAATGPRFITLIVGIVLVALSLVFLLRTTLLPDEDLAERAAQEAAETEWRTPLLVVAGLIAYALPPQAARLRPGHHRLRARGRPRGDSPRRTDWAPPRTGSSRACPNTLRSSRPSPAATSPTSSRAQRQRSAVTTSSAASTRVGSGRSVGGSGSATGDVRSKSSQTSRASSASRSRRRSQRS